MSFSEEPVKPFGLVVDLLAWHRTSRLGADMHACELQEEGHHSQVRLPNGVHWEPESCWDSIYDAINDARVLCYVVGVWPLP